MYAFRKPFTAATYDDLYFFGSQVGLKTALIIAQIIGYAFSKYLGVKICPETTRGRRATLLVALIVVAELALVLFAVLPLQLKVVALFLNGLPLGMVWGLVVWYLEGRQTSEILLAGLSCSFIISSGIVKDVGRALLAGVAPWGIEGPQLPAVSEYWMPAASGALFLLPFLLAVWMLDQIPDPTPADEAARSRRAPMTAADRRAFVRRFLPGIVAVVTAYVFLTALRDFRDNYTVDILLELGQGERVGAISTMETVVAFGVLACMAGIYLVKNNRRAIFVVFLVIWLGLALMGLATWMLRQGAIDGYQWLLLIGLGSYLAYVPYGSVLFDRLMASTRAAGTAVFAIYLADAFGYTGSIAALLFSDFAAAGSSRLDFLADLSYVVSGLGVVLVAMGGMYFVLQPSAEEVTNEIIGTDAAGTA
jgi:MFS family permease